MAIGDVVSAEWRKLTDPDTGRDVTQLTSAQANSYPLYYFVPSHTADGHYLVFHSERSGWVQLYRLDLVSGDIAQLTEGRTPNSGWAVWCAHHLRGIYNHLSALNRTRREVYYFQDEEIRCTHLDTFENRLVHRLPDRISIGQTAFSPNGRLFAFIHADRAQFEAALANREALQQMGRWNGRPDHQAWRNSVPTTVGLLDTETGVYRDVIALDYQIHHLLFLDHDRLLINHPKGDAGMCLVRPDGSGMRTLRPRDAHGAICHQVVTERGVYYEADAWKAGKREVWLGRYDPEEDTHEEIRLPGAGYVHTGNDPAGKFLFIENQGETHELLSVHFPHDPHRFRMNLLRRLSPVVAEQRFHAHPFLAPNRRQLFYTDVLDGFSQVGALDVADLADLDEYWDRR